MTEALDHNSGEEVRILVFEMDPSLTVPMSRNLGKCIPMAGEYTPVISDISLVALANVKRDIREYFDNVIKRAMQEVDGFAFTGFFDDFPPDSRMAEVFRIAYKEALDSAKGIFLSCGSFQEAVRCKLGHDSDAVIDTGTQTIGWHFPSYNDDHFFGEAGIFPEGWRYTPDLRAWPILRFNAKAVTRLPSGSMALSHFIVGDQICIDSAILNDGEVCMQPHGEVTLQGAAHILAERQNLLRDGVRRSLGPNCDDGDNSVILRATGYSFAAANGATEPFGREWGIVKELQSRVSETNDEIGYRVMAQYYKKAFDL